MKVLIVAHPDDEVIWFAPEKFDKIIIVFEVFGDGRSSDGRREALREHPLRDRITRLGLQESNFWRDSAKAESHSKNYESLCGYLKTVLMPGPDDEVTTHGPMGEYQHADHLLVHKACMASLNCPVNGKDPVLYRAIRRVYEKHGCWTWH